MSQSEETSRLFDNDCECVVLSQMFMSESVIPNILNSVQPDDFFNLTNRSIFKAIRDLYSEGVKPDPLAVHIKLGKREEQWSYILSVMDQAPTTANWDFYTKRVKLFSQVRSCIQLSRDLANVTPDIVEETLSKTILRGTEIANVSGGQTIRSIKTIIPEVISMVEDAYKRKGALIGLDSGIEGINDIFDGYPNDYIIIGARPSIGKTALAGTLIRNIAKLNKVPVGFVTIEMRDKKIVIRMVSSEAGLNSRSLRNGHLKQHNFTQIQEACERLYDLDVYFDDASSDLDHLVQTCRTMVRCHGVKAIFIDHASMITVGNDKQHWEKMSLVSKTVKSLQRELDIPMTLLCQLVSDAEGRKPTLGDLRGSGEFVQDADTIMLLHRERVETKGHPGIIIPAELAAVKTRDGDIGEIPLSFFPETTTFRDPVKTA